MAYFIFFVFLYFALYHLLTDWHKSDPKDQRKTKKRRYEIHGNTAN